MRSLECEQPGPDLVIAPFMPKHQSAVRTLVLSGLAERWGTVDTSLNHDLDDIASSYATGTVLIAVRRGSVVGTGAVVPRDRDTAEILRMSVARSERRNGIGRMLVVALIEVARSWAAQRVICETSSHWTSAVELYVSCGFRIDHEEHSDFGRDTYFAFDL